MFYLVSPAWLETKRYRIGKRRPKCKFCHLKGEMSTKWTSYKLSINLDLTSERAMVVVCLICYFCQKFQSHLTDSFMCLSPVSLWNWTLLKGHHPTPTSSNESLWLCQCLGHLHQPHYISAVVPSTDKQAFLRTSLPSINHCHFWWWTEFIRTRVYRS